MSTESTDERFDTVVIGGGQSGLSIGYHLAKLGRPFVILEANSRVGDSWRQRYDSLRLFTPGWYDGLTGMRFTGARTTAPTKDQLADYLEAYRDRFDLPVRTGVKVTRITKSGEKFVVEVGASRIEANQVVVATGAFQTPRMPSFAKGLDPQINQLHSRDYKNPSQLKPGSVLLVGAGNSGADISVEVARAHQTYLAGRHPGHIPFRIDGLVGRHLVHLVRFVGYHILTNGTPAGRKALPIMQKNGAPLVRVKPKDILAAGVERVPRVVGVKDGLPQLEDGRVLDVANVIWCTGFHQEFSWINLPIFGEDRRPIHHRGVVDTAPGFYFLGLEFQYSVTSDVITGVGRDAAFIASHIAARTPDRGRKEEVAARA